MVCPKHCEMVGVLVFFRPRVAFPPLCAGFFVFFASYLFFSDRKGFSACAFFRVARFFFPFLGFGHQRVTATPAVVPSALAFL